MKKCRGVVLIFFGFILFSCMLPQNAYAYLEVGTGSYLFQVGLAVFLLFVFSVQSFIKSFFRYLKNTATKLIRRK